MTQHRLVYSLEELQALHAGFRHLLEHGPACPDHGICNALALQIGMDLRRTYLYDTAYEFMEMVLDLWPWALRVQSEGEPTVCDKARMYPVPGDGAAWGAGSSAGAFRRDALEFCAGVCELMLMSRGKPTLQAMHDDLVTQGKRPKLAA